MFFYKRTIGQRKILKSDAKRFSGTDIKCRCNKAKVLEIQNLDGSIIDIKEVFSFLMNFLYIK